MGAFPPGVPTVLLTAEETAEKMTTFGEKLAAAREARPTKDVQVVLDGELAVERERLMVAFEGASDDQRLAAKSEKEEIQDALDALTEAASEALVTLRFTRMPGRDWAELTSKHPVRIDVPIDRRYGYNYDAACEAAAVVTGVIVDGDETHEVAAEEWRDLFDVLSGNEVGLIRDAVWSLNEFDPQQRLDALVKSSGAASRSGKI